MVEENGEQNILLLFKQIIVFFQLFEKIQKFPRVIIVFISKYLFFRFDLFCLFNFYVNVNIKYVRHPPVAEKN